VDHPVPQPPKTDCDQKKDEIDNCDDGSSTIQLGFVRRPAGDAVGEQQARSPSRNSPRSTGFVAHAVILATGRESLRFPQLRKRLYDLCASWLSVRDAGGGRTLGPRWLAAVFETPEEARTAMADLPKAALKPDVTLSVEQLG